MVPVHVCTGAHASMRGTIRLVCERERERGSHSACVVPIPGRTQLHGPAVLVHMVRLQWRATVFAGRIRSHGQVVDSHRKLLAHRWDCPRCRGGLVGTLERWARLGGPSTEREGHTSSRATTHSSNPRLPGPGGRLPRTFQNATTDLQACKASHMRILPASVSASFHSFFRASPKPSLPALLFARASLR